VWGHHVSDSTASSIFKCESLDARIVVFNEPVGSSCRDAAVMRTPTRDRSIQCALSAHLAALTSTLPPHSPRHHNAAPAHHHLLDGRPERPHAASRAATRACGPTAVRQPSLSCRTSTLTTTASSMTPSSIANAEARLRRSGRSGATWGSSRHGLRVETLVDD
jgi:hypothetical protein